MNSDISEHIRITEYASSLLSKISGGFYQPELDRNEEARHYVYDVRGLTSDTVHKFGIGFGSLSYNFGRWLGAHTSVEDLDLLMNIGILKPLEKGTVAHRFGRRITLPIHSLDGTIVGFSGRKFMEDDTSTKKYMSNPGSWLYQKSMELFGLYFALESIEEKKQALLVEGNIDVISLHQAGITWAVAPCGTAFTQDQAYLLKSKTDVVVGWFDNDAAGKNASKKAKELCSMIGISYHEVDIPDAKDPDEVLRDKHISPEDLVGVVTV